MLTGELTLAMPHAKVVELRFQARVHGYHTDDLVCTFVDDSGTKRMALLQAKRDTRAVASDAQFVATLSAAWLDFSNPDKFNRGTDRIVLVYETTSGGSLNALRQVANLARGSADAREFSRKVQAEGFSAQSKRDVLELVISVVSDVAGTAPTEEEVRLFLSHCWVVQHRLGDSYGQETVGYINTIQLILGGDLASQPDLIWADIAQRCTQFNAEAATVTQERLGEYFSPRLVKAFAAYRQTGIAAATRRLRPRRSQVRAPRLRAQFCDSAHDNGGSGRASPRGRHRPSRCLAEFCQQADISAPRRHQRKD